MFMDDDDDDCEIQKIVNWKAQKANKQKES